MKTVYKLTLAASIVGISLVVFGVAKADLLINGKLTPIRIVDGDTIHDGTNYYRLIGYDTPETYRPRCHAEYEWGLRATARLTELLADGSAVLTSTSELDKYNRLLAEVTVKARKLSNIMISEGLARRWPITQKRRWCKK